MLKKIFIFILSFVLIITGGFAVFKLNGNRKYEDSHKSAFLKSEITDDLKYLLNEPLTLTNKVITDDDIEKYKEKDEVYIIKSPKRLGIKIPKKVKKIVFIKTKEQKIAIIYYKNYQEVRIK